MPGPVRALHIVRRYGPLVGGTERYVHDLAAAQANAGYDVTVLTLDRDVMGIDARRFPARETVDGVSICRVPGVGTSRSAICLRPDIVAKQIRSADVVHLHDLRFLVGTVAVLCRASSRQMVLHTHGLLFHTTFARTVKHLALRYYYSPLLRLARAQVIASSEPDHMLLVEHAPALKRWTITLENCVDLNLLLRLEPHPQQARLVVVGRLAPSKGVDDLLRAMALVTTHDWQLELWGAEEPGERDRLVALAASLGLGGRLIFHGAFEDFELPDCLAKAGLAIFPSKAEGFGLALLEAMAAGSPVLASDIPAHRALLGPGLTERLLDMTAPADTAKTIEHHLAEKPADLVSLAARERQQAALHDVGRLKRDLDALYVRLGVGRT
jgi:glycosyltransferase involved in cell wall biosynthesis